MFGAFDAGRGSEEHNAAFFLDPSGAVGTYRKSMLFPLTERVPSWLDTEAVRAALPWTGRWTPGPGARVVEQRIGGNPVRFAPLICYEAIHPEYVSRAARAGANVLLTLSNDAWFLDDAAPRLHLAAAALRSVELRLPQIRATNSGISALILPTGEIVSASSFGARAALRLTVPRVHPRWTPALAWGDWVGPGALGGLALAALFLLAPRRFAAKAWE